ncbi:MAG: hypothetical protein K6G65_08075 [Lachnospiraceae bacterium]|nr:hypothetical protein [Lachnospiraceae bacterium]
MIDITTENTELRKQIFAMKSDIQYEQFNGVAMAKLSDFKTELFEYIVDTCNQMENGQLPGINKLIKKFVAGHVSDSRLIDLSQTEDKINGSVAELISSFEVESTFIKSVVRLTKPIANASVVIYVARGNNVTLNNITLNAGAEICAQNTFNIYGQEGYRVIIKTEDAVVAFEPDAGGSGIKGDSVLNVYAISDGRIFKDDASKYIDVSKALNLYKG